MEHAVDFGGDESIVPILNSPANFIDYDYVPVCDAGPAEKSIKDSYSGRSETTGNYLCTRIYERGHVDFSSSSSRNGRARRRECSEDEAASEDDVFGGWTERGFFH